MGEAYRRWLAPAALARIPGDAHRARLVPARPARARPPAADGRPPGRPSASCRVFVLDPRLLDAGRFPSREPRVVPARVPARAARRAARARREARRARAGGPSASCRSSRARTARRRSTSRPTSRRSRWRATGASTAALDGVAEVRRHPGNFVADIGGPRRSRASRTSSSARSGARGSSCRGARSTARRARCTCRPASPPARSRAGPSRRPPSRSRPARPRPASALSRWLADGVERYAERHDRLAGGTSRLSPYLHFGCVSAREVEARARDKGGRGTGAFVRQLAWRDFYAHVLLHHPGNAEHAYKQAVRRARVGVRRRRARRLARGPHRLPRRRRRACASSSTRAGCTTARG